MCVSVLIKQATFICTALISNQRHLKVLCTIWRKPDWNPAMSCCFSCCCCCCCCCCCFNLVEISIGLNAAAAAVMETCSAQLESNLSLSPSESFADSPGGASCCSPASYWINFGLVAPPLTEQLRRVWRHRETWQRLSTISCTNSLPLSDASNVTWPLLCNMQPKGN